MTTIDHYHDRMTGDTDLQRIWRQMKHIEPFDSEHLPMDSEHLPVTEQEDEAFNKMGAIE